MATLNNVHIPAIRPRIKANQSKTPDFEDPNNYCNSCDFTFKSRYIYHNHLIKIHRMLYPKPLTEPISMRPTVDILSMRCDA
ncbi:hypothetical protein EDC94DRAFT_647853, partial [Helicostylum pulchrum]